MAADMPWVDPREIDDLAARYPSLPRSRVELAFEAYWPMKNDVEAALSQLVDLQQRQSNESLDFTDLH
jgi:hypothetical protein